MLFLVLSKYLGKEKNADENYFLMFDSTIENMEKKNK